MTSMGRDLLKLQASSFNDETDPSIVSQLQRNPHLGEELLIGFSTLLPSLYSSSRAEKELLRALVIDATTVTLPVFRWLAFREESTYFECLVAQIRAPFLERFKHFTTSPLLFHSIHWQFIRAALLPMSFSTWMPVRTLSSAKMNWSILNTDPLATDKLPSPYIRIVGRVPG